MITKDILVLRKDKDTAFITDSVRTEGRNGQRVSGKMVWTFSVHSAIDIKKGSVINVVCCERVCYERVWYEHGLLWKWSVLNRSVMNGSVMNVVCFELSVMSGLLWTRLFWMGTILKHNYVFMSHEFQSVYFNWVQVKSPLILKVVVAIAYVAKILTSKIKMQIIGNDSEVFRMSGKLN